MKVSEIKSGYLLKLRCGHYVGVYETRDSGLSVSGECDWFPLDCLNEDTLEYKGALFFKNERYDVMEVWGRTHPRGACDLETEDRELLWERKEAKCECECDCECEDEGEVTAEEAAEAAREFVDALEGEGFTRPEAMAFLASLLVGGLAVDKLFEE